VLSGGAYRAAAVAALSAAAVAAGCGGGSDGSGADGSGTTAPAGATTGVAAPTGVDVRVARLVQRRGDRLDSTAAQLLGDTARLDAAGLRFVAPTRLGIARRMQRDSRAATAALAPLAPQATAAADVAATGGDAFPAFEECARENVVLWRGVVAGEAGAGAVAGPRRTCDAARAAFDRAEAALEELPEAPTATKTAPGGDAAGGVARVVVRAADPDDPQSSEVVQEAAPGSRVAIVYSAENTSTFDWRLRASCAGPLTFTVSMIVQAGGGSPAIDPAEAGYRGAGTEKEGVRARVTGQEAFQLRVGTFTIAEGASGDTRVLVSVGENRCPDPVTKSPYSPISGGAGISEPLVLRVGG